MPLHSPLFGAGPLTGVLCARQEAGIGAGLIALEQQGTSDEMLPP
jgi:hypothetical protein